MFNQRLRIPGTKTTILLGSSTAEAKDFTVPTWKKFQTRIKGRTL